MSFDIMDFRHALHILGKGRSKIRAVCSLFALGLKIEELLNGFEKFQWRYIRNRS